MQRALVCAILMTAFVCGSAISEASAADDRKNVTVACKAVNKVAKVGTFEGTVVSITIIEKEPECRFSINGAEVGSPPTSSVINGINSLIRGSAGNDVSNERFDLIAFALLAASPDTSVGQDLLQLLRNEKSTLSECLRQTPPVGIPSLPTRNDRRLICGRVDGDVKSPEVNVKVGSGSAITLGLIEPVLVIGAARDRQTHYLVIPIERTRGRRELIIPPGR